MGEKNLLKQDSSIEEKELNPISGWIALFIGILFILSPVFGFINLVNTENDIFLKIILLLGYEQVSQRQHKMKNRPDRRGE